ncbi:hypothetical protein BDY21DRAFT_293962 [Lineolata rhizophorae]|uniref:VHS domain-containing protein n=1 Tax=Lineolata rhizophorae TaxID=578093 RepID=A0A6A6NNM4_9PEZI|nr:hypothetical protein BDY21DRAFT_293962 [Lineolata rhizophorae]
MRLGLKKWLAEQKKPYSAVTVQIDQLTGEPYDENDVGGLVDLVEVIRIQQSGSSEAARALRKKLKYGSAHRQLRALTILDGLLQNAGPRFQEAVGRDEPLLERLRLLARDDMVDAGVRRKCTGLYRQWGASYKNTPGLERVAALYKQLPHAGRRPSATAASSSAWAASAAAQGSTSTAPAIRPVTLGAAPNLGSSSSGSIFKSRDKKSKKRGAGAGAKFNLEKEKPRLMECIAQASVASTNLTNGLRLINREAERVSANAECVARFEACRALRRQVLRYIQLVESEDWIGGLLAANDELVKALRAYEVWDKSVDEDSDSEAEYLASKAIDEERRRADAGSPSSPPPPAVVERGFAGLRLGGDEDEDEDEGRRGAAAAARRSRPGAAGKDRVEVSESDEDDEVDDDDDDEVDENNPFGDQNAVKTPYMEKGGMNW